ncbi:MAG: hypothetical protein DHS20C05_04140 [Hyphococcus sp.]|nr:MAG: hypothetical protein DHS20C05_04140 [Marinicaulis sp.]
MERARIGLKIDTWEPFVWEYSSGVFILLLLPFVFAIEKKFPLSVADWKFSTLVHAAATIPFSIIHVGGMVAVRSAVYAFFDRRYDFGNIPVELFYEWRKDAFTYFTIVVVVNVYRTFREHADGAATMTNTPNGGASNAVIFQIVKDKTEILIASEEIDWIEAAGNYVILHSGDQTHMMRDTLKSTEGRLGRAPFVRVHRSALVNMNRAVGLTSKMSGGAHLQMRNGATINVSKRHLPEVKRHFAADAAQNAALSG